MFFDSVEKIKTIAEKTGFSIFGLPSWEGLEFKNAFYLRPNEKGIITVDMVKDFLSNTDRRQKSPIFYVVEQPEAMDNAPANIMLKTIEEPKENYHFVFLSKNPSALLPTILSRAEVYFLKKTSHCDSKIEASEEIKDLAKRLMVAKDADLPDLAKKVADKKDRIFALEVVSTAIEMSYKTFFLTSDSKFLKKLPNLLNLYDNLSANGHIKLHFVADML